MKLFVLLVSLLFLTGAGTVSIKTTGDTVTRHGRTSQYFAEGFADSQTVHLDMEAISAKTAFMLVDISDTTNWKHTNTDHVIIKYVLLAVDPDTNYRGEIQIGFLSNVDATNGDFNLIFDLDLAQKSDLTIISMPFTGNGFHTQLGTHFGPITANSTLFQTDLNLGGPDDSSTITYPSGDGDLVVLVKRTAGTTDAAVTIIYETVGS